jgi:hypothetical protein
MSSDESNNSPPSDDNESLARRLAEIEKQDFGDDWKIDWNETFKDVPARHRSIVLLAALFPFWLLAMVKTNCPPYSLFLAGTIVLVAIGLLSRDLYNARHRQTNQIESRRSGESSDQDR